MVKQKIIVYPLLAALFPVLSYWASNYSQAGSVSFWPLIFLATLFALVFFLLSLAVTWNLYRAAFLALLAEMVFFSYGHVYTLLSGKGLLGVTLGQHHTLIIISIALVVGVFFLARKAVLKWEFQRFFNVMGIILIALPAMNLAYLSYLDYRSTRASGEEQAITTNTGNSQKPDIYYIILDGYTRGDVLQDVYGYDNRPFYRELGELGFVTPACAQSNYGYTQLSMTATLNMCYLDDISPRLQQLSKKYNFSDSDFIEFKSYVKDSEVVRLLKAQGYQIITFQTGYQWLDITTSDRYIEFAEPVSLVADYFETTFLRYSMANGFVEKLTGRDEASLLRRVAGVFFSGEREDVPLERKKHDWVITALSELENLIPDPGPKFIYLHLLSPHSPYVFAPDGSYDLDRDEMSGYVREIQYLNGRVIELLRKLMAHYGDKPVVVVLQGDHGWKGPGSKRSSILDRMKILNAYYLPGAADKVFPQITPVNTFRLIFDNYLGTNMGLLENKRYLWGLEVNPDCTDWTTVQ